MYFWRIEEVVRILSTRGLTESEAFRYLFANIVLLTAFSSVPIENWNVWDTADLIATVVITAAGLLFCYRLNGGAEGTSFVPRILAIMWVMTIRILVLAVVTLLIVYTIVETFASVGDDSTWWEMVLTAAIQLILYWRIATHLKAVRMASS